MKSRWRALLVSAAALGLMVNLWLKWVEERERQAQLAELLEGLPVPHSDRIAALAAHPPDSVLLSAILTGFMIAFALTQWSERPR